MLLCSPYGLDTDWWDVWPPPYPTTTGPLGAEEAAARRDRQTNAFIF